MELHSYNLNFKIKLLGLSIKNGHMNKSPLSKHKDIEPGYKKLIIQHKIDCQELEGREDWTNEIQIQKKKYLYDLHIS